MKRMMTRTLTKPRHVLSKLSRNIATKNTTSWKLPERKTLKHSPKMNWSGRRCSISDPVPPGGAQDPDLRAGRGRRKTQPLRQPPQDHFLWKYLLPSPISTRGSLGTDRNRKTQEQLLLPVLHHQQALATQPLSHHPTRASLPSEAAEAVGMVGEATEVAEAEAGAVELHTPHRTARLLTQALTVLRWIALRGSSLLALRTSYEETNLSLNS